MATNNKRPDSKSRGSSRSDTTDGVNLEFGGNKISIVGPVASEGESFVSQTQTTNLGIAALRRHILNCFDDRLGGCHCSE